MEANRFDSDSLSLLRTLVVVSLFYVGVLRMLLTLWSLSIDTSNVSSTLLLVQLYSSIEHIMAMSLIPIFFLAV